jgi:hypothetical protein
MYMGGKGMSFGRGLAFPFRTHVAEMIIATKVLTPNQLLYEGNLYHAIETYVVMKRT